MLDGKADTSHTHVIADVTDVTASASELNILDGATLTTTELNYVDGVTSAVQTQIDGKASLSGATFTGNIEGTNATFTGNVTVQGELQVVDTTNYSVRDNMIYLNQAGYFDITNAVGNGTAVVYTVPGHSLFAGDYVVVTGIDPSGYNIAGTELLTIDSVTTDTITVLKTDTGTYVSGGIIRGKSAANPDLGWAAGRTDGVGYAHTGIFRDATDATYKFFDGYTPEPDESLFIDTSDASFALAPIAVSEITVSGNVTATNFIGTIDGGSA